ncbi:unnamed protein product [Notodromas monacha]|uniref:Spaetzle domain-containing protein n=1 Tax=Notodromas monacha TaxID=399045 RepID=A0A7R9GHP7_9CRUS|nr:unnamed protein product [Notodromas monacha]CAG0923034.1 unnamed protein product [Notodromas monacha]
MDAIFASAVFVTLAVICQVSHGLMPGAAARGVYTRLSKEDVLARKSLDVDEYPEGYYAFNVAPNKMPPKVRKPPYSKSGRPCPGVFGVPNPQGLDNLCGNLNTGFLPPNPMGQTFEGDLPYPFDLIRNKTLDFFSKALPILKEDETLPKVDIYGQFSKNPNLQYHLRKKRSTDKEVTDAESKPTENDSGSRSSRALCDSDDNNLRKKRSTDEEVTDAESKPTENDSGSRSSRALCDSDDNNFLCKMYKTVTGSSNSKKGGNNKQRSRNGENMRERMDDGDFPPTRGRGQQQQQQESGGDGPSTPCPTTVEYVTPIFARNYQGVWRYIVQIPYEGYFTQTVEVTKCMNRKCNMLEGSCLAAPRWVSLLVSEMFYPETTASGNQQPQPQQQQQLQASASTPQGLLQQQQQQQIQQQPAYAPYKPQGIREGRSESSLATPSDSSMRVKRDANGGVYCDGYDDKGCFQVRMYYDWFLVSGSCKCWKQSFNDYINKK